MTKTKYIIWGKDLDPATISQMDDTVTLPISIKGALMPDAHKHLETNGSGNHFAEFGKLTLLQDDIGLKSGKYIAFLTHSGSRGAGAKIADHFSSLAKKLHPELGKPLNNLAWPDIKRGGTLLKL